MIELVVVDVYVMEAAGECLNAGACCYGCPLFDSCDHPYEEQD